MNASMLTASHYGVVHFGDLDDPTRDKSPDLVQ